VKGGYALVLSAAGRSTVKIGSKTFDLEPGKYAYAGSALGPGGIECRVGRHIRRFTQSCAEGTRGEPPVKHWHVDYLPPMMALVAVVAAESRERLECRLARALKATGAQAIKGFGATDCREGCGGHLLFLGGKSGEGAVAIISSAFRQMGLHQVQMFRQKG
jgi:Uri superfamily endonuclease